MGLGWCRGGPLDQDYRDGDCSICLEKLDPMQVGWEWHVGDGVTLQTLSLEPRVLLVRNVLTDEQAQQVWTKNYSGEWRVAVPNLALERQQLVVTHQTLSEAKTKTPMKASVGTTTVTHQTLSKVKTSYTMKQSVPRYQVGDL